VFLLGAWRNFEELEECLTMDELVTTYNKILSRRNEEAEFQAKIAGAEIRGEEKQEEGMSSLKRRIQAAKDEERLKAAAGGKKTQFSEGIGYTVIGG